MIYAMPCGILGCINMYTAYIVVILIVSDYLHKEKPGRWTKSNQIKRIQFDRLLTRAIIPGCKKLCVN